MIKRNSVGGVVVKGDNVVIVSQKGDSWSLPKGGMKKGETELQTAIREIYEESGIKDLELVKKLGSYQRHRIGKGGIGEDKSVMFKLTFFLFKTEQATLKPADPDNPQAIWVPKKKVAGFLTHPKDKKFYQKLLKKKMI